MKKKAIAVITARGGSKRIPYKNIREFCGTPIIGYSIRAAIESEMFEEIMVSTDDVKIANTAQKFGAKVPFLRSAKTADDYATSADVMKEVLLEYENMGRGFEIACCIYPTAPFVTGKKLQKAMEELEKYHRDCVMPVTAFSFPPLRGMLLEKGKLSYKWDAYAGMRSQDLEQIFHDCGQFYLFRVDSFLRSGKLVMENTGGIPVSELEVQDIDNETDWKLAELKYRLFMESGN